MHPFPFILFVHCFKLVVLRTQNIKKKRSVSFTPDTEEKVGEKQGQKKLKLRLKLKLGKA